MSKNWSFIKIIGLGLNFIYEFEVCSRELTIWENVLPPSRATVFFLSGGASRWRVCYQLGLPRLVLDLLTQWTPVTSL